MAFQDQADDWLAVGICQAGGGAFAAGGVWLFQFQSFNAGQYSAFFAYMGLGLGGGGSIGGISLPDMLANGPPDTSKMAWAGLSCDTAFSANDLNWAPGRVSLATLSAVVGYSLLSVSAANFPSTSLFSSQSCNGWGTGVGLAAVTTVGMWKYVQDAPYQVIW